MIPARATIDSRAHLQAAAENDKNYEELASELETLADTLNSKHIGELSTKNPNSSAARIAL